MQGFIIQRMGLNRQVITGIDIKMDRVSQGGKFPGIGLRERVMALAGNEVFPRFISLYPPNREAANKQRFMMKKLRQTQQRS